MALKAVILLSLMAVAMGLHVDKFLAQHADMIPKMIKNKDDLIDFVTERKYRDAMHPTKLTSFKWLDCGGPKAMVKIHNVMIGPDPVVLPGTMKVSFSFTSMGMLDTPLIGNVTVQKKVGTKYIELPCIDMFGSCHYDDLCDLLPLIPSCPEPLQNIGIMCTCPLFKKMTTYTLPMTPFDVEFGSIPAGDYHFIGAAITKDAMGACIDLMMTFA